MTSRSYKTTAALLGLAGVLSAGTAMAEIGTVAAVNQTMEGTPPQNDKRLLILGDGVVSDERIQTSSDGSGQLLFVDQTSLSVAADSDIILDRYIYDPEKKLGDIALSIARGSARFIGGLITKKSRAIVRTPSATIGIRGGMALIQVDGQKTKVTNIASISIVVETYGDADGDGFDDGPGATGGRAGDGGAPRQPQSRVVLTRSSSTATSDSTGTSFTGIASDEELAGAYQSFEGDGDGGTADAPDSNTVNDGSDEVASTNSGVEGGSENQPVTTTGAQTNDEEAPEPTDPNTDNQEENNVGDALAGAGDAGLGSVVLEPTASTFDPIPDPTDSTFDPIPDPADIAALSGTAIYNGFASGTLIDTKGVLPPSDVTGTSSLLYDFDQRIGVLELAITPGTFTVEVGADAANAAAFSGNDVIFGGPDSISAQGGFRSTPDDVAARVEGTFDLDLQTRFQQVTGTYTADR